MDESWDIQQPSQIHALQADGLTFGDESQSRSQTNTNVFQSHQIATNEIPSLPTTTSFTQDDIFSSHASPSDEQAPTLQLKTNASPSTEDVDDLLQELLYGSGRCRFHDFGLSASQIEEDFRYTGPSSGLSVIKTSILSCTSHNIRDFRTYDFRSQIDLCQTSLWKIQQQLQKLPERSMFFPTPSTTPLPLDGIGAKYANEYFNTSQVIFPIVQRRSFEMAWRKNLEHPEVFDLSWYVLQNAVLAVGAFTYRSASTPASYRIAKEEALGYFNNALSLQASLMRHQTSLMAVQAACVMAMFAQIVGDFHSTHSCTLSAVQLAQSKGLHKVTANGTGLPPAHRNERERLFWIVYFFEKMDSLNTGRPSHVDDRDISCSFPALEEIESQGFSAGSGELLLNLVRLAHICSQINTRLYSATALNKDPKQLVDARDVLIHNLSTWRDRIPANYHAKKTPFRISSLPPHTKPVRAVLLRIAYQTALCAIHRRFSSLFAECPRTETELLGRHHSDSELLKAARELVLLLDQVEMDVDAPNWFFAYHLLTAVVPLFISVVANPFDPSTKDDIALMHVATGIFGRLEFITSGDFAFQGVTEFAPLATNMVDKANQYLGVGNENFQRSFGLDVDAGDVFSFGISSQMQNSSGMEGSSENFVSEDLDGSAYRLDGSFRLDGSPL